jgi:hypothetical protein
MFWTLITISKKTDCSNCQIPYRPSSVAWPPPGSSWKAHLLYGSTPETVHLDIIFWKSPLPWWPSAFSLITVGGLLLTIPLLAMVCVTDINANLVTSYLSLNRIHGTTGVLLYSGPIFGTIQPKSLWASTMELLLSHRISWLSWLSFLLMLLC